MQTKKKKNNKKKVPNNEKFQKCDNEGQNEFNEKKRRPKMKSASVLSVLLIINIEFQLFLRFAAVHGNKM